MGGAVGDVVDCRVDRPQCTCKGRGIGGVLMAWVVWIRDTHAVSINVANNGGKLGNFPAAFWSIFSFGTFSSSGVCRDYEWRLKSQGAGLTSPANDHLSTRQYLVQLFRSHGTTSNVLPQINHSFYCHWLLFYHFSSSFYSIFLHFATRLRKAEVPQWKSKRREVTFMVPFGCHSNVHRTLKQ